MDSSFAVQQYLEQLRLRQTSTVQNMLELPVGTDESLWLYEHMRLLCVQLNDFIVALQQVCAGDKMPECHEMKAGEWLYLCASHQTPQNCSAIDYCVHTLDAAIAVLNSNKFFPSRYSWFHARYFHRVSLCRVSVPQASMKQFPSIARRLYRIFAHAWYHHREVFDAFEVGKFNVGFIWSHKNVLIRKSSNYTNGWYVWPTSMSLYRRNWWLFLATK